LNKEQQSISGKTVNTITYRTPNFMLSSAQDYQPGKPGRREHIWQATLGPKCNIFTNHPGCSSEEDAHYPNYWAGNGSLPRVAQYKATLIAHYHLPDDALLKFTHAFFPTIEFDEYFLQGSTAFARKEDSYIALTAVNGLDLVTTGHKAFRELRSHGLRNTWICQMGAASADGLFSEFIRKCQAAVILQTGDTIEIHSPQGDAISFGWEGPFLVNGSEEPLSGFKHFENPFTTVDLLENPIEISNGEYLLRLNF
jgi:hypothetical protein